jgi:hypothetical protein
MAKDLVQVWHKIGFEHDIAFSIKIKVAALCPSRPGKFY